MKAKEPLGVDELGQDRALLQDHDHDSDISEEVLLLADGRKGSVLGRRSRSWACICLAAAFIAALVVGAMVWRYAAPLQQNASQSQQSQQPQLAIDLHPEEHNVRPSTTLKFHWDITSGYLSPDGTRKRIYLVNGTLQLSQFQLQSDSATGEFPGPVIEARSGDRIIVHVTNSLGDNEGLSLHWHGLQLRGHNRMDGAVGITQCPIPAGQKFIYDFQIGDDEHGTFWWHSHAQFQRADGLYGGLVVHKPTTKTAARKEREALLLVGDWFHSQQKDVFAHYDTALSYGKEPTLDGVLVNGQGQHHCRPDDDNPCSDGGPPDLRPILRSAETTRLRIVNTGTVAGLSFAMEDATLQVIEVDGGCPVETSPQRSLGILYPGERIDVVLDWTPADSRKSPYLHVQVDEE